MYKLLGRALMTLYACSQLAGQTVAHKSVQALADFSSAVEDLARSASPAVVKLTVQKRAPLSDGEGQRAGLVSSQEATGSGVIVDPDGYIVTNAHVVEGARRIDVSILTSGAVDRVDNHEHRAGKVIGVDGDTDLALIKVDGAPLPALAFRNSDTLKQGQIVLALGSPLALENSLTVGFISAPIRHLSPDRPMFYIQTDAPINPGNSGGPLLDIDGKIAGINTLIMSQSGGSEGIGFAIPSNLVMDVCEHLRKEGRVRRGAIGVIPETITEVLAAALGLSHHEGVILSDVSPHSPAEAAGLQPGDVVVAANGNPVRESRQFMAAMFQRAVGDEVVFDIVRGGERMKKTVTIMERHSSPRDLTQLANEDGQTIRRLGVIALNLDPKVAAVLGELRRLSGVVIAAIPMEYAGLNPGLTSGDVIYEFNGSRSASLDDLRKAMGAKESGAPIALLVERNGQLVYVSFELE